MIMTLSPITPKVSRNIADFIPQQPAILRRNSPFQYARGELDTATLATWTPEMVAQSMLNAGIELSTADRFVENDINGAIMMTLKFEDLKELDIPSFGIRTRVWHQIQALRDSRPASPRPETPIEDKPSREVRREEGRKKDEPGRRRQNSKRQQRKGRSDDITPMESVSIIGIEQVIPKPHTCSKGENCSKWRKQQQLLKNFQKEYPNVDLKTAGGTFMVAGDTGNPETAKAINPREALRPMSDAEQSIVASSDVLGPGGLPPLQYLQEATLRSVQARDPQDNVRHFLSFQQRAGGDDVPPTPPFEGTTTPQAPHQGLRRLPKLSIPGQSQTPRPTPPRASTVPQPSSQLQQGFVPYRMEKAEPMSPELETPRNLYRFGTPFSEFDVPVTAVPIGPVARDTSQSVPPDMSFRASPMNNNNGLSLARTQSRASARRPSFPVLPALDENRTISPRMSPKASNNNKAPSPKSPRNSVRSQQQQQQPLQAPPRFAYPWSPIERTNFEQAIPPMSNAMANKNAAISTTTTTPALDGVTHQGPMKKRKMRMLRHEWQDGYFTLKGTRLNMHKDEQEVDRTLEYIDIDDYAIACSSLASSSKLSAAFKAVHISHNREKSDPVAAFSFQLIPQDKNTARLRKRESALHAAAAAAAPPGEGVNGTGKTHHFAVKNRDDRIDWMRELMLAKALKQKGEGFEISRNGNMI